MHAQGPSGMGSIFYKTKLCSRFRSGNCPYNTNCNFAHGMEELCKPPPGWEDFVTTSQQQQELPSSSSAAAAATTTAGGSTEAAAAAAQVRFHKTRPCKKYFGEGNCPYGDKCNFLHDEQSVPRAVREAREAAVAANHTHNGTPSASDFVVANSPPRANGPGGGGGGSTASAAGSGPQSARPSSWKTKLCNKWETTGHCPFGDKCHFAHGSDELQRVGDANASAISETTSRDSWQQQRGARKGNSNWRGPNEISTIYGDWWVEDENWHAIHESIELEGDVIWGEA